MSMALVSLIDRFVRFKPWITCLITTLSSHMITGAGAHHWPAAKDGREVNWAKAASMCHWYAIACNWEPLQGLDITTWVSGGLMYGQLTHGISRGEVVVSGDNT